MAYNLHRSLSNLPSAPVVSCHSIAFALFCEGVYGDVHRVKILFNKKDNALIQMAEPHQAQLGMCTFIES